MKTIIIFSAIAIFISAIFFKKISILQKKDDPILITSTNASKFSQSVIASNLELINLIKKIKIEKISSENDTLGDIIEFLRKKINDPTNPPVIDFIVRIPPGSLQRRETFYLENIPADQAFKEVGLRYNISVYIQKQSVVFDF